MIKISTLTTEEREVWGECPVCHVRAGKNCVPIRDEHFLETVDDVMRGHVAHAARLINAPKVGAVEDGA
jgi:hypothetical protein